MTTIRTVLVTGANAGLGRECARQLADRESIEKIYLACRNADKAHAAKAELESETGRSIFEVVLLDVMDVDSVRDAVANFPHPVDAVVLNAGGMGGKTPHALTPEGVTHIFAVNLLGHMVLVDEMIKRGHIRSTVVYSASEAARGLPKMGVPRPALKTASVDEFVAIANGHKYGDDVKPLLEYGAIKLTAVHWMGAMARRHSHLRFVAVSPGATAGTSAPDTLPFFKRVFYKYIAGVFMPLMGAMHGVDKGAKRYVDVLTDSQYLSGHFYASNVGMPTGPLIDQSTLFADLSSPIAEDNAHTALQSFFSPTAQL